MESRILIRQQEKKRQLKLLEARRGKMQKPNGDVKIKPKPIHGTGATNG
jgi:hypothetical protein